MKINNQETLFLILSRTDLLLSCRSLYIEYDSAKHNALIGRNEIITPMIEFDNYYMLGNSFEIAKYTNKNIIRGAELHLGYFNKMAGVWDSGANGAEFHTMSDPVLCRRSIKTRQAEKACIISLQKLTATNIMLSYGNTTHRICTTWSSHNTT